MLCLGHPHHIIDTLDQTPGPHDLAQARIHLLIDRLPLRTQTLIHCLLPHDHLCEAHTLGAVHVSWLHASTTSGCVRPAPAAPPRLGPVAPAPSRDGAGFPDHSATVVPCPMLERPVLPGQCGCALASPASRWDICNVVAPHGSVGGRLAQKRESRLPPRGTLSRKARG